MRATIWKSPSTSAIDRGFDLLDHLAERDDILAFEVAALLREDLILDLDSGRARAFEHATVRIMFTGLPNPVSASANTGTVDAIADRRDVFGKFGERHKADVGHAKRHVGDAGAGDVDPLEAEILDHPGEQRIRCSGKNNRTLCGKECLELRRQPLRFGVTMH